MAAGGESSGDVDYTKIDASQLLAKLKSNEDVAVSHLSHMAPIIKLGEKKFSFVPNRSKTPPFPD